jgi:hypothetical protein
MTSGKIQSIFTFMNKTDFKYNEDETINWRAMVKSEYLYPNKDWFELLFFGTEVSVILFVAIFFFL